MTAGVSGTLHLVQADLSVHRGTFDVSSYRVVYLSSLTEGSSGMRLVKAKLGLWPLTDLVLD